MKELMQAAYGLLGIRLTTTQLALLSLYERELLDWNTRFNLTAIDDPEKVRIKHFLDSMTCLQAMREKSIEKVIDIGTGAGFPGIPLKILVPSLHLTLVESVGKKVIFCKHVVSTLALEHVEVIQARAEDLGQEPRYREQFDWAVARAVAILPVLAEYLLPLVRVGGGMLAMKGESALHEAQTAQHALHLLGGHIRRLVPVTLPGVADDRYLVIVDKIAATPGAYPRRVGVPSKKPLN